LDYDSIHLDQEHNPLVLVIDDSVDVHRLLKARLRSEHLELQCESTGSSGLQAAVECKPAIILLDLDMPGMDGFEVLRTLKDGPETMRIPVIVLSGLQSPHDKVTAFDLGAVDYITKPFDLTELRVRVRSALRLHLLLEMLNQKAQVDGLTGLWNRAYFDERWTDEVGRLDRRGEGELSLAMIDLDHFKSINDTFGHPAGDAVLEATAKILQRECRKSDSPCRYGGEEFALIMPDTGPEQAVALCNRIREAIQEVVWPRHPERRVTGSVGVAGSGAGALKSPSEWIEVADKTLYAAKTGGRNRVHVYDLSIGAPRLAAG
jgi:diguanylate cyclase (GGDEF)-like protein